MNHPNRSRFASGPTDQQIDIAVLWLENNEGDEASDCKAVARWLDEFKSERNLRQLAREHGVPVAKLRERMEARRG